MLIDDHYRTNFGHCFQHGPTPQRGCGLCFDALMIQVAQFIAEELAKRRDGR